MEKLLAFVGKYRKGLASGIGNTLAFLELWLTPHTTGWIIVGAILAGLSTYGVVQLPNDRTDSPAVEAGRAEA